MACKEFVHLVEDAILAMDRLSDRVKRDSMGLGPYSRQQMTVLVRLYLGGQVRLKDIALRERIPTPNLCAAFRKLEREGLVARTIDDEDRRNTWYQATEQGAILARTAMNRFREAIAQMFEKMSCEDEKQMVEAMKVVNKILTKMEMNNA